MKKHILPATLLSLLVIAKISCPLTEYGDDAPKPNSSRDNRLRETSKLTKRDALKSLTNLWMDERRKDVIFNRNPDKLFDDLLNALDIAKKEGKLDFFAIWLLTLLISYGRIDMLEKTNVESWVNLQNKDGNTPVHFAFKMDKTEIAKFFFEQGGPFRYCKQCR